MNILVTGGKGKLAQQLGSIDSKFNYLLPSKFELNLFDGKSVRSFFEHNQHVDILVHNAYSQPSEIFEKFSQVVPPTLDEHEEFMESAYKSFQLYSNAALLHYLYCSLQTFKGSIFLTTVTDLNFRHNVCYRSTKVYGEDILKRLSFLNKLSTKKVISVMPGHMETEQQYKLGATKLNQIIKNFNIAKNRSHIELYHEN